jgi:hypothetical protein
MQTRAGDDLELKAARRGVEVQQRVAPRDGRAVAKVNVDRAVAAEAAGARLGAAERDRQLLHEEFKVHGHELGERGAARGGRRGGALHGEK